MLKILWLSPNFNHYKARFLNHLAKETNVALTIVSGTGRKLMGDQEIVGDWSFQHIKVNVSKKDFGKSQIVKNELNKIFFNFNWVLIPAEKKNILLFLYALKLKKKNPSVRLFSYNHPILKSKNGKVTFFDKWLTKFYYKKLDRVIFYTKHSHDWAVKNKLIEPNKAYWANNTIDNTEVDKYYNYQLPPHNQPTIVFIGRLIPSKQVGLLITYFSTLKKTIPNLSLEIIGDGPEQDIVKEAAANHKNIIWHGTLVDEEKIAPIMARASMVFVPGHSGLSINHAFAYGRPYITLESNRHGPEISYLHREVNGYILGKDIDENMIKLTELLTNQDKLNRLSKNALETGVNISVQKWVQQIKASLLHE